MRGISRSIIFRVEGLRLLVRQFTLGIVVLNNGLSDAAYDHAECKQVRLLDPDMVHEGPTGGDPHSRGEGSWA